MPWVSKRQQRWGNSPAGHKALGDAGVREWNAASKGQNPPEKADTSEMLNPPKKKAKP